LAIAGPGILAPATGAAARQIRVPLPAQAWILARWHEEPEHIT